MKIKNSFKILGAVFVTMSLVACGSSSSSSSTASTTTLGFTSVPPSAVSPKPSFASNILGKTLDLFSSREAIAQAVTCPPTSFAHSFTLADGTVWVTQVYAVWDEIHFEDRLVSGSDDSPDDKKSVVDLTATDPNVPDSIPLIVPTGRSYDELHMKIQRLEDEATEQPVNVTDLSAFLTRIGFTGNDDVRPSIYIEGVMAQGTTGSFTTCTAFKFVTDRRWDMRIPLNAGRFDIDSEEAVLHVDIEGAFKATPATTVTLLEGEVGFMSSTKPLGGEFLDGRLKKDATEFGSPEARKVAARLAANVVLHTLPVGSFSSDGSRIDDSDPEHHRISGDDGDASTDDNVVDTPEVETETETGA